MAGKENMGPVPKGPGARGRGPRPKIENPGKVWGDVNNYHMILDTSQFGIENCANILIKYFERIEVI